MKPTELRTLIKESIQEYIKEIDEAGDIAALEAKISKTQEAIDKRKKLTQMEGLDEEYHAYLDERKMKEMTSEIKHLEKSLGKYEKTLDKLKSKASWNDKQRGFTWNSQQIDVDGELEEMTNDPAEGPQMEEDQLDEAKKKMTSAQKEKKEDIVKGMKKSDSFGKSKKETAKMYATATKLAKDTKKESVETEAEYQRKRETLSENKTAEELFQMFKDKDLLNDRREYDVEDLMSAYPGLSSKEAEKLHQMLQGEALNESFLHMQKLAGLITEAEYKQKLNESLPEGKTDLGKKIASALNPLISKMDRPDLESKARGLAGQLISLADESQK